MLNAPMQKQASQSAVVPLTPYGRIIITIAYWGLFQSYTDSSRWKTRCTGLLYRTQIFSSGNVRESSIINIDFASFVRCSLFVRNTFVGKSITDTPFIPRFRKCSRNIRPLWQDDRFPVRYGTVPYRTVARIPSGGKFNSIDQTLGTRTLPI